MLTLLLFCQSQWFRRWHWMAWKPLKYSMHCENFSQAGSLSTQDCRSASHASKIVCSSKQGIRLQRWWCQYRHGLQSALLKACSMCARSTNSTESACNSNTGSKQRQAEDAMLPGEAGIPGRLCIRLR